MAAPRKTGVIACLQCHGRCPDEIYTLKREDIGESIVTEKTFCSRECMMEFFEDELFHDKLHAAIQKEQLFLYKNVCPACLRRLQALK